MTDHLITVFNTYVEWAIVIWLRMIANSYISKEKVNEGAILKRRSLSEKVIIQVGKASVSFAWGQKEFVLECCSLFTLFNIVNVLPINSTSVIQSFIPLSYVKKVSTPLFFVTTLASMLLTAYIVLEGIHNTPNILLTAGIACMCLITS